MKIKTKLESLFSGWGSKVKKTKKENADEISRLIIKGLNSERLMKIGNRTYQNLFKYPCKDGLHCPEEPLEADIDDLLRHSEKRLAYVSAPSDTIFMHPRYPGRIWDKTCLGGIRGGLTDASTVTQAAINASSIGSLIFLKSEAYVVNNTILIDKNVSLVGEGRHGSQSKFKLGNGVNKPVLEIKGYVDVPADYVTVSNLYLDGNKDNQTVANPVVYIHGHVADLHLEKLVVVKSKGTGITVQSDVRSIRKLWMDKVSVESCDGEAIFYDATNYSIDEVCCIRDTMTWNSLRGLHLKNIKQTSTYAYPPRFSISNFIAVRSLREGILLEGCEAIDFFGVSAISNSYETDNAYDGVRLVDSKYINFHGLTSKNYLTGSIEKHQRYGIRSEGTSDYITVLGKDLSDNKVGPVSLVGTHNSFKDVLGYVTENSGTATIANNEWLSHGLVSTPTTITLTPRAVTYGTPAVTFVVGVVNRNATMFQVGAYWTNGTAITVDAIIIDWSAIYLP